MTNNLEPGTMNSGKEAEHDYRSYQESSKEAGSDL